MSKSSSGARHGASGGRRRAGGSSGVRPGSGRGGVEAFEVVPAMVQRSPFTQGVLFLLRWAVEFIAGLLVVLIVVRLVKMTGWPAWAVVLVLLAPWAGLIAWPKTRHWALAPVMVRVVRHRLRAWMLNAGIRNRSGRLPWTLLVLPTRVGVRVWLWMIPGLSVRDFHETATEEIATACYGRTARVERSRSLAALVRIDVVLRDPLLGRLVASDLAPEPANTGEGKRGRNKRAGKKESGPLRLLTVVPDLTRPAKAGLRERQDDEQTSSAGEGLAATGTDGTPSNPAGTSSSVGSSTSSSTSKPASSSGGSSTSSSSSSNGSSNGSAVSRFGGEDGADYV